MSVRDDGVLLGRDGCKCMYPAVTAPYICGQQQPFAIVVTCTCPSRSLLVRLTGQVS